MKLVLGLEDNVSSVRDSFAEALGALLALAMNPAAQVKKSGKGQQIPAKKMEDGLQKHLILPFIKASGANAKNLRVGLALSWVFFVQGEGGDIIDCVDIYKQPAFENPLMKDHKIQMKPSRPIREILHVLPSPPPIEQEWQKSGTCPEGTVPILRTRARNTTRATNFPMNPFFNESLATNGATRDAAYAYSTNGPYHGANADIYVWDVHVEPNEYSINYIAVGGTTDGHNPPVHQYVDNAISLGWMASPILYGDSKPRLFLYWSNDGGKSKNCWNLQCGGFVQTNHNISLGTAFFPTSVPGGEQRYTTVTIYRDSAIPKWWVAVNLDEVGYLPDFVFNNFPESVLNGWGGQILNTNPGGQHTSTQMGSGRFPSEGVKYAGMIGNYLAVDYRGQLANDYPTGNTVTHSSCYDYQELGRHGPQPGYYILYGGPGGPHCSNGS